MDEASISHGRVPGSSLVKELRWNITLMFCDCVDSFNVLRYGPCKLVKIPRFGCKLPLWCTLTEKMETYVK